MTTPPNVGNGNCIYPYGQSQPQPNGNCIYPYGQPQSQPNGNYGQPQHVFGSSNNYTPPNGNGNGYGQVFGSNGGGGGGNGSYDPPNGGVRGQVFGSNRNYTPNGGGGDGSYDPPNGGGHSQVNYGPNGGGGYVFGSNKRPRTTPPDIPHDVVLGVLMKAFDAGATQTGRITESLLKQTAMMTQQNHSNYMEAMKYHCEHQQLQLHQPLVGTEDNAAFDRTMWEKLDMPDTPLDMPLRLPEMRQQYPQPERMIPVPSQNQQLQQQQQHLHQMHLHQQHLHQLPHQQHNNGPAGENGQPAD